MHRFRSKANILSAFREISCYQLLLNGTLDELLYNRGRLVTGGLSFPDLKQREHINTAARVANQSSDFSTLIRVGRATHPEHSSPQKS